MNSAWIAVCFAIVEGRPFSFIEAPQQRLQLED